MSWAGPQSVHLRHGPAHLRLFLLQVKIQEIRTCSDSYSKPSQHTNNGNQRDTLVVVTFILPSILFSLRTYLSTRVCDLYDRTGTPKSYAPQPEKKLGNAPIHMLVGFFWLDRLILSPLRVVHARYTKVSFLWRDIQQGLSYGRTRHPANRSSRPSTGFPLPLWPGL